MKKLVVLLAVAGLMAGSAMAQVPDPGPDSFGLYAATDAGPCFMENFTVTPGFMQVHMVIAGPSAASVGGLEIQFALDDEAAAAGSLILNTTFNVSAIDVDDRNEGIIAGFSAPIAPNDCADVVMVDLGTQSFILNAGGVLAGPNDNASVAGYPAYLDGDSGDIITLNFAVDENGNNTNEFGWLTVPLFAIPDAPIATEDATWSDVRGLYR
jgi:hypothetical protein